MIKGARNTAIVILMLLIIVCVTFFSCNTLPTSRRKVDNTSQYGTDSASRKHVVILYDKNLIPASIKAYLAAKWGAFSIASPDEKWDGSCSSGSFGPNKQLVSITIDTVSHEYFISYYRGGIAAMLIVDYFQLSKDSTIVWSRSSDTY